MAYEGLTGTVIVGPPFSAESVVVGLDGPNVLDRNAEVHGELAYRIGETTADDVDVMTEFEQSRNDLCGARNDVLL